MLDEKASCGDGCCLVHPTLAFCMLHVHPWRAGNSTHSPMPFLDAYLLQTTCDGDV